MAMAAAVMSSTRNNRGRSSNFNSHFTDDYALRGNWTDEEHDGPGVAWLCVFFVVGGVFLTTGFYYAYASFYDPRMAAVAEYNRYVDDWNSSYRRELETSTFEWRVVSPLPATSFRPAVECPAQPPALAACLGACADDVAGLPVNDTTAQISGVCTGQCWLQAGMAPCTPVAAGDVTTLTVRDPYSTESQAVPWQPFTVSTDPDPIARGQRTDDVETYVPYTLSIAGVLPADPQGAWEAGKWTGPAYTIEIRSVRGGVESAFVLGSVPLMREVFASANQKMCRVHHNNNWHDGACWDRSALSGVCMNLNYTAGGWVKGTGAGGAGGPFGCKVSKTNVPSSEVSFAPYCPGTTTMLSQYVNSCDFSLLQMQIRSSMDPHIRLWALTDGTLNFGQTPTENWRQGIILVCVGAFLYLPLAPIIILKCCKKRARRLRDNSSALTMDLDDVATATPHPPHYGNEYNDYDDDYDDGVPASGGRAERYAQRPDTPPQDWDVHDAPPHGTYVRDLPGGGGGGGGMYPAPPPRARRGGGGKPPGTYVRDTPV